MALAEVLPERRSKPGPLLSLLTPGVTAIGCGMVFGIVVLVVSERPTRWLVYLLAAVVVAAAILAGHARRQLMVYFIVGLSLNVHYYVTQPEENLFLGMSAPRWFSIPLPLIPAIGLGMFALMDSISHRRRIRWITPVTKPALLLIATATLSTLLSLERRYGVYAVAEMCQYFFIYLVATNMIRKPEDFELVLKWLLITMFIQCLIFVIQTATGETFTMTGAVTRQNGEGLVRASGTVGTTPSGYAIFIEPLLFTTFALWRIREPSISRRWVGFLAVIGAVTLVLTLNRTSWLTLLLGGSVVEILCRRRGIARQLSWKTLLTIGVIFVISAIIVIPLILPRLQSDHSDDWNTRRNLMRIAISMIAGNPIVGVGPGAYAYHLKQYAPPDVLTQWLWVVHNEFLLIWAERGLLGFLAWLAWMRSGFRQALLATTMPAQQVQALGIGCVAALIGLWWEYTLNMWPPFSCYALLWFLFGVLVAGNEIYAPVEKSTISDTGASAQLSAVAV